MIGELVAFLLALPALLVEHAIDALAAGVAASTAALGPLTVPVVVAAAATTAYLLAWGWSR